MGCCECIAQEKGMEWVSCGYNEYFAAHPKNFCFCHQNFKVSDWIEFSPKILQQPGRNT